MAVNSPDFKRVVSTVEEREAYAKTHHGRKPAVERSECRRCGTRIWHSGLAVGSHRRACGKVVLPEGDEITDTRTDGEQDGWEAEARSYVIGLPVVVTVYPDGTVKAEVDLSEADDVFEASTPEGQDDSEEVLIADRETISNAVIQARVTVSA